MFGAVVRSFSSTLTAPRGVSSTPASAALRPSVLGAAAGRDEHRVRRERLFRALPARGHLRVVARVRDLFDRRADLEGDALCFERLFDFGGDIRVLAGQEHGRALEHRDLRAEARVNRGELEPDVASADDCQPAGELFKVHEPLAQVDERVLPEPLDGRDDGGGAGVDEDLLPLEDERLPPSDTTRTCVGERKLPHAVEDGDVGLPSSLSKFFLRSMAVRRRFSSMAAA